MDADRRDDKKFFSKLNIILITCLMGPIAGGLMFHQNLTNIGKRSVGNAYLIAIAVLTIFFIVILYFYHIPVASDVPKIVYFPAFAVILNQLAEVYSGRELSAHKANGGKFYSDSKTFTTGLLGLVILIVLASPLIYAEYSDDREEKYELGIASFKSNEDEAMEIFTLLRSRATSDEKALNYIRDTSVPNWEKNVELVKELKQIKRLELWQYRQLKHMQTYSELRLSELEVFDAAISNGSTYRYRRRLTDIRGMINEVQYEMREEEAGKSLF